MSERRRLLMRSSENLAQLIQLAILHEENIQNEYNERRTPARTAQQRNGYEVHTYEFNLMELLERYVDQSNNINVGSRRTTFDISDVEHLITNTNYSNILNPINTSCPITREEFNDTDEVIMINACRHIFKKIQLLNWLQRRQTCPCCRINLL